MTAEAVGTTTVTRKGQVTIPKPVRERLGLRPFDRVEVELVGNEARLRKAPASLEEIAGSLPPLGVAIEEMPRIAREERARRRLEEGQ